MDDDELMRRTAEGDTSAFDQIVRRYQHRLQRFASRMLGGDCSLGADIAVAAFLKLWEKRNDYRIGGPLEARLIRTAYWMSLDVLRSPKSAPLSDRIPAEPWPVIDIATAEAVRTAVMDLAPEHRAVLVLSVYEELSYDEIAAALDIPLGTVGSRKNHAIAMLKRRLSAWENP